MSDAFVCRTGDVEDAVFQRRDGDLVLSGDVEGIKLLHLLVQAFMIRELRLAGNEHRMQLQVAGFQGVTLTSRQIQTEDLRFLTLRHFRRDDFVKSRFFGRLDLPALQPGLCICIGIGHCISPYLVPDI